MLADDKGKSKDEVASWTGYPGGAPCNVACGLGQLNIPVAFVSCLGNDERGRELLGLMQSTFP
jgi:fructokinase